MSQPDEQILRGVIGTGYCKRKLALIQEAKAIQIRSAHQHA